MAAPNIVTSAQTNAVIAPVTAQANSSQQPIVQGANAFRLLAEFKGVNVNATNDSQMFVINSTSFSVFQVVFTNASVSLTTAAAGVFTGPGATGTAIVANAALTALTGPTVVSQRTVASTAIVTTSVTMNAPLSLYLNVGTAQGAAATMDVYVYGFDFS